MTLKINIHILQCFQW